MTVAVRRPDSSRIRLLWLLAVLFVGFALLASKLADLQLISADRYNAVGESQRTVAQKIAAERGTIYDRNGVELVMSKPAQSVFVDPALIDDPFVEASAVAPILGLDVREVEAKMRGEGRFAYLARKVTDEQAQQIAALSLPGVALVDESQRYRPSGDMARSILGEVDVDNAGISGLEQAYGDQLTGTPGEVVFERDPEGRTIPVGDHQMVPAVKGDDLVLTIDRSLQYEAERILADQVATTQSRGGIAIVTKPATGEILAMANMVLDEEAGRVVAGTNAAGVTTVYEPGSVMKMAAVGAALEHGVVNPDTVIQVPPVLRVGDQDFTDAEEHGPMAWTVTEVLAHSSNIGTIKVAQQLGKDRLYQTLRNFGFGEKTAVDFPNELAGVVPDPSDPTEWWSTSMGTVPIGQGVSVTPLQMLLAYNVIANGGRYVEPRLVRATRDADGVEHPVAIDSGRRVFSQHTADQLNLMLRDVVVEGTGQNAAISGYTPAGKTGTSRKALGGGYTDKYGQFHYQSTFVGFVPAEQPALSVIVIIDEPGNGQYTGGVVAAPAWSRIASFALQHLGVPPPLTDGPAGGVATEASTARSDGKVRGLPAEQAPPPPLPDTTTPTTAATTTTPPTTAAKKTAPATSR